MAVRTALVTAEGARGGSLHCICNQEAEREGKSAVQFIFLFVQFKAPAHGIVPSVCRVVLCLFS